MANRPAVPGYVIPTGTIHEDIAKLKYYFPGEKGWSDIARRAAKSGASAERLEEQSKWEKNFYDGVNSGDLIPGGRILFGAGRLNYNMLNCYVLEPDDSVASIGKTIHDMYKIACSGGGIGFNYSNIRPKGESIQNIPFSSPGSISTMKMINEIGSHVKAGKSRRTALIAILNVSHPDLLEFLDSKLDRKELTNFNISVGVTNRFIEAVENNEEWYFTFGGRHIKYCQYAVSSDLSVAVVVAKSETDAVGIANAYHLTSASEVYTKATKIPLKARTLWDKLLKNAVECGEPGIFNIDFTNTFTNVSYFERLNSTNPCGEQPLPAFGNCCLGHVNLANMVSEDGIIDYRRIARTVRLGVRYLDNILEVNTFPIAECKEVGHRSRRIGLGVLGFATFLIKAGFRYGSESCIEFTERLFETIRNEAYKASMSLAKEKGSFPAYDWQKLKNEAFMKTLSYRIRCDIKQNGLRNASLLTVAPTGTVAMIIGVSTGIEPIFSPVYKRRWKTGTEGVMNEALVIDPIFKKMFLEGKDVSHIVGAYDVTPEEHLGMQVAIQSKIDAAISKTCNLPASVMYSESLSEMVLGKISEVKGLTFYRAGSRGDEPLEAVDHRTLDLDALIKEGKLEILTESIDTCKSGVCEL